MRFKQNTKDKRDEANLTRYTSMGPIVLRSKIWNRLWGYSTACGEFTQSQIQPSGKGQFGNNSGLEMYGGEQNNAMFSSNCKLILQPSCLAMMAQYATMYANSSSYCRAQPCSCEGPSASLERKASSNYHRLCSSNRIGSSPGPCSCLKEWIHVSTQNSFYWTIWDLR